MNKRFPRYPDDADYQTNSPSYYEDLARKQKLIQLLAEKIWEYENTLDETFEQIEQRITDYILENDSLMNERLENWDQKIDEMPEEMRSLFVEWLNDGTLEQIINHDVLGNKANTAFIEIEPEDLRENPLETDGDLLQKAIDLVNTDDRKTKSIKLGRMYEIEKTINVGTSISYKKQPWLIIRGSNGGLKLAHDGYMFDGNNNGGGLLFSKVKFEGSSYNHPLINGTHLIQISFEGNQFYYTGTIIDSTDYLQSIRFFNNNFKGMRDYQIKAPMIYDMQLLMNVVEWGKGGFLNLTQTATQQYASIGLYVKYNVIEGISEQAPIKTTHLGQAVFSDNYFEGNNFYDLDLEGGVLPHRSLTIKDNSFGNFPDVNGKEVCVKVGALSYTLGYDFTGNTGTKTIFDFSDSNARYLNLTGGRYLYNHQPSYKGTSSSNVFYGNLTKPIAKKTLEIVDGKFEYSIDSKSPSELVTESRYVKLNFMRKGSSLYSISIAGFLYFVTGYNSDNERVELQVAFKPDLSHINIDFSGTGASAIKATFKSTGEVGRHLTDKLSPIRDTIVFNVDNTGNDGADTGYLIEMDDLIIN